MLERRPAGKQWRTLYRLPANPDITVFGGLIFAIVTLLVVVALWVTQGGSQVEVSSLADLPGVKAQPATSGLSAKASGTTEVPAAPEAPPAPPGAVPARPDQEPAAAVAPAPAQIPAPVVVAAPVVVPPAVVVPPPVVAQPPPGPALRPVPDVVGVDQARAARALREDGLSVGSVKEEESNQPAGTVLRTDPRAGAAVWPGSSVDLVVAKRSDQVKVPDVVGKDQARAVWMLRAGGLSVGSVKEEESNQPAGTVLQTSPKAGTAVRSGSAVDLVVAKAPPAKEPSPSGGVTKKPSADMDRRGS